MKSGEKKKKKPSALKKIFTGTLIVALLLSAGIFGSFKFMALYPYAITAGDDVICYVEDKESASAAVKNAFSEMTETQGDILLVSAGDKMHIQRADTLDISDDEILSTNEATKKILESTKKETDKEESLLAVTVKKEVRTFMPDTVYEKDETMLAGESKVVSEGKEGKEEVTVNVTMQNGTIEEEEDMESVVIEDGESPVVIKGVLGLPEGEDWTTYTGEPVANNGSVITTTGQKYIGKVRYRKGGTSLSTGVDCVGFVRAIYRLYGIDLPANLRKQGRHVSYSDARAGDIICYPKHYGIYIGGGKMVHATSGKGVSIGTVSTKKLTDVRRIINH